MRMLHLSDIPGQWMSAVQTFSLQEVTQTLEVIILEEEVEGL